jgi:hypothetical protein
MQATSRTTGTLTAAVAANRRNRAWQRVAAAAAALVVFCTTYALILPAITASNQTYCGQAEHMHTDTCYTQTQAPATAITCDAQADFVAAQTAQLSVDGSTTGSATAQTDATQTTSSAPNTTSEAGATQAVAAVTGGQDASTTLPTTSANDSQNTEGVTGQDSSVTLLDAEDEAQAAEDTAAATSEDAALETESAAAATAATTDAASDTFATAFTTPDYILHTHNSFCYDAAGTLICQLDEFTAHTHTDDCYITDAQTGIKTLTCTLPELALHTHTAACITYTTPDGQPATARTPGATPALTCGQPQVIEHTHTAACQQETGGTITVSTLTCGQAEHVHSETCFTRPENLTYTYEDDNITATISLP